LEVNESPVGQTRSMLGYFPGLDGVREVAIRFIITVLVATVLHAVACILVPPFEFASTRPACFFWACRSGIVALPILFAVVLLPLRAGLRRFMPGSSRRAQAIVAGLVLYILLASLILARQLSGAPVKPYEHSYLDQWIFWSVFIIVVTVSFFWPLGGESTRATVEPMPLSDKH
jgi:hypothetical protein